MCLICGRSDGLFFPRRRSAIEYRAELQHCGEPKPQIYVNRKTASQLPETAKVLYACLPFSEIIDFPATWGFGCGVNDFRIATVTYVRDIGELPIRYVRFVRRCNPGSLKGKTVRAGNPSFWHILAGDPPHVGAAISCGAFNRDLPSERSHILRPYNLCRCAIARAFALLQPEPHSPAPVPAQ